MPQLQEFINLYITQGMVTIMVFKISLVAMVTATIMEVTIL